MAVADAAAATGAADGRRDGRRARAEACAGLAVCEQCDSVGARCSADGTPSAKKTLFRGEAAAKDERALLMEASDALAAKGSGRGKGKGHVGGKGGGRGRGDAPEPPPPPWPARY